MSGTRQQSIVYADIDIDLDRHPVSGDAVRVFNEYAIIRAVKNLLLTDFYERPFKHNIGSNIRQLLFENITTDTQEILRQSIVATIESFEPRCNLISVNITPYEDENAISVSITFSVINREEPITLDVYLDRIR
jgi:phage baseplate assembly protein W